MASRFATTRWTIILQAADSSSSRGRASLEQLCNDYWAPLHSWVQTAGYGAQDAEDLTQAFFAHLLSKALHVGVDPVKGRFRNWLIAVFKHFMLNERRRATTQKRGGTDREDVSLEQLDAHLSDHVTPDRVYERKWAHAIIYHALERLQRECEAQGHHQRFTVLQPVLFGEAHGEFQIEERAAQLGITVNAARVTLTRLRQRYRELLRVEVGRLVETPDEVDDEIAHIIAILRG